MTETPQPRAPRRARTVLLILLAVLVVCCGAGAVISYGVFNAGRNTTGPMRDGAIHFLDNLREHDFDSAYGRLCDRTTAQLAKQAFIAAASARPLISYGVTKTYIADRSGLVDGTVIATLTYADGTSESHALPMVEEDGVWRVCGNPY
jgi:hypothetical protein